MLPRSATQAKPGLVVRTLTRRLVPIGAVASCNLAALAGGLGPTCNSALEACLAQSVTEVVKACQCQATFALCYSASGCGEMLPRSIVTYCRTVLACDYAQCAASGEEMIRLRQMAAVAVAAAGLWVMRA